MKKTKKIKNEKLSFFNFDKRLFPKKARAYHHEVQHATLDLIDVYNRVDRTYLLCERNVKILMAGKGWLSHLGVITDFESLTYHLENFWLRAFSYREKICQLINAALDLRFSEKSSLFFKLIEDSVVRRSSIKVELDKFIKNKVLYEILNKRKLLTHRIYYETPASGYDRSFRPISKELVTKKSWLETMRKEIVLCNKFLKKATSLNDTVMVKLIKYKKEINQ